MRKVVLHVADENDFSLFLFHSNLTDLFLILIILTTKILMFVNLSTLNLPPKSFRMFKILKYVSLLTSFKIFY